MDKKEFNELVEKVKGGSASLEEKTRLLREINTSIEKLNGLLENLNRVAKKKN